MTLSCCGINRQPAWSDYFRRHCPAKCWIMYGSQTIDMLNNIKVNVSFVGTQAMTISEGIFAPTIEKAKVKRLMMKCGQAAYLVVDSSKLNHTAFSKICDLKDFTGMITDDSMSQKDLEQIAEQTSVIWGVVAGVTLVLLDLLFI